MSPLIVDSDDDEDDSDDEDDEDDEDEDDDEPSEGVPIEQYRAWLGESLAFIMLTEKLGDYSALYKHLAFIIILLLLCLADDLIKWDQCKIRRS